MVLNRADPTKIAIAPGYNEFNSVNGNFVYVAQDTTPASATSVDLVTTKVGTISTVNNGSEVTKLAYGIPANNNTGASANPDALLAGVQISQTQGQLWFSPQVGSGGSQLVQLTNYSAASPTSMVFDPTSPSAQSSPGDQVLCRQ
jgi:hypothetical protein